MPGVPGGSGAGFGVGYSPDLRPDTGYLQRNFFEGGVRPPGGVTPQICMKILITGGGGREHALAWKAAQSPLVEQVYVAPGNFGTSAEPKMQNVDIQVSDIPALVEFAKTGKIDLTIAGPEGPLVAGIADAFEDEGLKLFGPSKAAARLEGSKGFAKEFLKRHHIPTARFEVFTRSDQAETYVLEHGAPIVIKADGLAAGKGVVVAMNEQDAVRAVHEMLDEYKFGEASASVVIEDFLEGEEASFIVMSDGENALPLATSQDHKRVGDGDTGPNTGGMGAYSPAPVVTPEVHHRIMTEIIEPVLKGMREENAPYQGFLYAGLMIDAEGNPKVVEFNCRMGDPETQPIMMRMRSDLVELCLKACTLGGLKDAVIDYDPRPAVGVVLASHNYPNSPRKGCKITGLDSASGPDEKIFHAGTRLKGGDVVNSGGRVLCVTALGADIAAARNKAYALCEKISFDSMFYRKDIAWRALKRS